MSLHELTVAQAGRLIRTKVVGIVELTKAFLDRIDQIDPQMNAYATVTGERAMDDARLLAKELAEGRDRGPLHGIPIALKDIYDTADIPTHCGSNLFASRARTPATDSVAASRLRSAGTVMLGKLTTHEFALGGPSFDLPTPPARNPWGLEHFTGGSSSGSGAAMAAGTAMATLGSDTAGSIRMPAYFCGIHGLKPTYGRVSRRGVAPLAQSMDHCGPMTRTAHDAAIMMQAIAGHDTGDPGSADVAVDDYSSHLGETLSGKRIGLISGFYDTRFSPDASLLAAMAASVKVFTDLGAIVEEVELPPLEDFHACGMVIMLTEALANHADTLRETPHLYGEIFRERLTMAAMFSGIDYVQAVRRRAQLAASVEKLLGEFDLLMTAGGFGPAPRMDEIGTFGLFERPFVTTPFNLSGHPVTSVCGGFSPTGLPLGFQLVGKYFGEAQLLGAADAFERATTFNLARPVL